METVNIIIEMEDGGVMKGELYPEIAPISVENFLKLIDQDFFAGLIFQMCIRDRANTKEKALETYRKIFNQNNLEFDNIKVASQIDVVSGGNYED